MKETRTCTWQTAYGLPWSETCTNPAAPGSPWCAEHIQDARDLYPHLPLPKCCSACENTPGILFPVNGNEIQRCEGCAPDTWSDVDAANELREKFPWLPITFDPDRDDDGEVIDPEIGMPCFDLDRLKTLDVPEGTPGWLTEMIDALRTCDTWG